MNKILYLEGLRGYMSIWVFLTHALTMATFPLHKEYGMGEILVNGFWPVSIFILLSGFVTNILLDKNETYKIFLFRRFFRLFPIYIISLIISIMMLDFAYEALSNIPWENAKNISRMNLISKAYDNHFIINAVWHFLLLHGLLPEKIIPAAYTIMGQSWSLTLEWQFYIVIPFIHNLIRKEYSKNISVLLFLMIFILIFFAINYMPQNTFLPNMIHYFMIGYFSYFLYKREDKRYLYIFLTFLVSLFMIFKLKEFYIILLWAMVLFFQINNLFSYIFTNKLIIKIAETSYSFYCLHMIVLFAISYFLISIIEIKNQYLYGTTLVVASFLIAIILSRFTYNYIEKPMIDFGRKMRNK